MLGWRLAISAVLIPLLAILFWYDAGSGNGAVLLMLLCVGMTIRSAFELTDLLSARSMKPSFGVSAAGCVLVVISAWMHTRQSIDSAELRLLASVGWIGAAFTLTFLLMLVREAFDFKDSGHSMESLGANLLIVSYCGVLLAMTAQFRWFPSPEMGYFAIGSVVIAAKSGDIGAYTLGRLFGKRKMAPRLSPGKTWAGAFGAVLGSCLGGGLWLGFAGRLFAAEPKPTEWIVVIGYCVTMGVIGLIGDLCESLIKRDVQKKDSARLMPGFGGLLDLLDSVLFSAPVALAWWVFLPPAG